MENVKPLCDSNSVSTIHESLFDIIYDNEDMIAADRWNFILAKIMYRIHPSCFDEKYTIDCIYDCIDKDIREWW